MHLVYKKALIRIKVILVMKTLHLIVLMNYLQNHLFELLAASCEFFAVLDIMEYCCVA